jgi:hypothetical protein
VLPTAPVPDAYLRVIARALSEEWASLVVEYGTALLDRDEAELNALMETRLGHAILRQGPFAQLVSAVARGRETSSYDGRHLEKRPDLSIFLTRSHPSFPLVAECKIIDSGTSKGIDLYCDKGIRRFVDGEYAWAAQEGLVMAYVRDGSAMFTTLVPYLSSSKASPTDRYLTQELPTAPDPDGFDKTIHGRNFHYVGFAASTAPGPLALWHLWLP